MTVELLSRHLVRTVDSIGLPSEPHPVEGRASREDAYTIHVTTSLAETAERLTELIGDAKVAIVTDSTVMDLYGPTLVRALDRAGIEPEIAAIPPGEQHKTLGQACRLLDWLTETNLGRRDVIVCLGGGVVIDMGGWVASAYMRGVPYLNIPTTLIGQVDAGIGGKLAVNHETAKNIFGGFFQPIGVISDVSLLATLDRRQLRAGLAESIKKAIIASPAYWDLIEHDADAILRGDLGALERLVHGAGVIKAELIARDPYEVDSRRTLGFGHAIAHPLETVTGYRAVLHGEAVAFGMVVEMQMAAARELLTPERLDQMIALLRRVGLPTAAAELPCEVDGTRLLAATERIRLIRGGGYRFVLPIDLGETLIADDVEPEELHEALRRCGVDLPR
ncbi:MAG TPA: 3-dehydroquinate synthase family protein [Thermoleophilaceae bacterium]